jgi:hypothetical protein
MHVWVRHRAASIDRGIFLEAAAAGLRTREVPDTRKPVPGGLEGAVYEVRWAHLAAPSGLGTAGAPAEPQGQRRRFARGLGAGQSGLIAAATLGPLLAGLAASYFIYQAK